MNWSNVKLILAREIRDQLRDRRTLFMIAVLPLFLYPLLGMSFFQVAQLTAVRRIRALALFFFGCKALCELVEALLDRSRQSIDSVANGFLQLVESTRILTHLPAENDVPDLIDIIGGGR